MSHWTTTKPTAPGWYWWRHDLSEVSPTLLEVGTHPERVAKGMWIISEPNFYTNVKDREGEWSSDPIAEPEEVTS